MGLITDFVVARREEADAIAKSMRPANGWPTVGAKGVDPIKLASLYCAATGMPYSSSVTNELEFVSGDESEGPWVLEFSSKVLKAIASIHEGQIAAIASTWAATEELQLDRWSAADAAQFLEKLTALSQRAVSERSSLFLRMSL